MSAERRPVSTTVAAGRPALWAIGLAPVLLLGVLLWVIVQSGPAESLRGAGHPPVEILTFQRVVLGADGFSITVLNDGPDPVTIAQVIVDDAYWAFTATNGTALPHLGRTTLNVPYPWVEGEAHAVRLITATGVTFDHEIAVAVQTPEADGGTLLTFTLIGVYVGMLPVAIGLLWFPLVRRLGARGLDFILALTIGLLIFLLADATHEGLESALVIPASYQGVALFFFGAFGAYLGLEALGRRLERARGRTTAGDRSWLLALLVAVGIGLHNFSEGLAIGAAFVLGEAALGTLLIVGFTLHNTTEGLAIVAPLARSRPPLRRLVTLGLIGGVPTIAGAWVGGFVYSPVLSVLFLAIGAGAIAQVATQIARQMAGDAPIGRYLTTAPVLAGLAAGFVVMYATGMLVG
jgi:zinc transporter ZupT